MSTAVSATMGIVSLGLKGFMSLFPIKSAYLGSSGCTATAVSPTNVSSLVVATTISVVFSEQIFSLIIQYIYTYIFIIYSLENTYKQKYQKITSCLFFMISSLIAVVLKSWVHGPSGAAKFYVGVKIA